jgi:ribonuclease HI
LALHIYFYSLYLIGMKNNVCELNRQGKVVLQWIPSRGGTAGNERADKLVKERGKQIQKEQAIP